MFSKLRVEEFQDINTATNPKRRRLKDDFLPWKFWFLQNYTFLDGGFTTRDEIIEAAEKDQENVQTEKVLSYPALGSIVDDVWGNAVKNGKRGPRGQQKKGYINIVRKTKNRDYTNDPVRVQFRQMVTNMENLPHGWGKVVDSDEKVCFMRLEKWDFENQRMSLELSAELTNDHVGYVLKSHGIAVNIDVLKVGKVVQDLPIEEQIVTVLSFLNTTTPCLGFQFSTEESLIALKPHQIGVLKSTNEDVTSTRAFSLDCQLVTSGGSLCSRCQYLKKLTKDRTKRKQQRGGVIKKKCNKRYLSKSEVEQQLREEKKLHRNSNDREKYWREKCEDFLEMEEEDHTDLCSMFNDVNKNDVPDGMQCLWEQQRQMAATKNKKTYRWHPKIIRLCLELYCKNPHVLDPLRKYLILPSNKTIRLYKNKVQESPGWNDEILEWCLQEAKDRQLKEGDFWGGFVIDEMKIQENLEMVHRNGKHTLVGFVNLGETHDMMSKISGGTSSPQLATHVLQFIYLSDHGFRFPIAQFPSASCTPSALYFLFWEGVIKMQEYGFVIYWCILDGADANRQFIKLHFKGRDPVEKKFVVENIYTGNPMVFIMDPKHNIKKIRNNILKSNDTTRKPRCLKKGDKAITWAQFKAAYDWDQNSFSLPLHEKLTLQHFELDPSSKMRNHLAENVLDSKMLFLMQKYQERLKENGKDGSALDATIELLSHTSNIVGLFGDKLYISSTSDSRLTKLDNFYKFLMNWREETKNSNDSFISSKLFFDLQSMCLGFQALVSLKLARFPTSVIKPAIVNQVCAENHFCQIRACNGQNNNPTFAQQQSAQNSIRLGQTTISRKSNAGNLSTSNFSSCSLPPSCARKT